MQQHDDVGSALHLLHHRERRREGPLDGRLLHPEVVEPATLQLGVHPHPVEGVGGVGRGVPDPALLVHQDDAVTHPGCLLGGDLFAREGKGGLGEHHRKPFEDVAVGALQMPGASTGTGRQPGHDRHHLAVAAHRDALESDRLVAGLDPDLPAGHLAGLVARGDQWPVAHAHRLAHQVVLDHGGAVGRSHLAQNDHLRTLAGVVVGDGGHQCQVGERQVGEHPPGPQQPQQMGQLHLVESGALQGQFGGGSMGTVYGDRFR